jgi:hypothetical protein
VAYIDDDTPFLKFNFAKTFVDRALLERIRLWGAGDANSIDLYDAYRERFGRIGIACFTPNWDCPPMWAHYAQNWQGFVLEYHVNQMEMAKTSTAHVDFSWVNYVERVGKIALSELLFSPYETSLRYLSTKSSPWSYEKEWRLVNFNGGDSNVELPVGMELTKIILGPKSPSAQTNCLTEKVRKWDCVQIQKLHIAQDRTLGQVDVFG